MTVERAIEILENYPSHIWTPMEKNTLEQTTTACRMGAEALRLLRGRTDELREKARAARRESKI